MNTDQAAPSPIEQIVAWALPKYLEPSVEVVREHPVSYRGTEFRLDFLLRHASGNYGLECDGKEFHRGFRDSFRDACILDVSDVTAIYRLGGRDIHSQVETALHLVATDIPAVFTPRGRANLCTLSQLRDESLIHTAYDSVSAFDEATLRQCVVMKLARREEDPYWHELFSYAQRFPGLTLEQIADRYVSRSSAG